MIKVTIELYGETKNLSKKNYIEIEIKKNSSIKDIKLKLIKFVENKFNGKENLKKLVQSSSFCSDKDEIIQENYKIKQNQVVGIIPPIGGG
tara:strand:- start:411 stop:683 length:273 start_codon:yes stop_codon:yes gene_type:complete